MKFDTDDWIATSVDGEHWVILGSIFKRIYEEVEL